MSRVLEDARPTAGPRAKMGGLTLGSLWVFVAVFLPVVASLQAQLSTVDLAYHIRAGGETLDTGSIPRSDTFTFTGFGREWLNQQWGAQVLLAQVYRWGGWEGLAVARAVLVACIFGFAFLAARAAGAGRRLAAWFTVASFLLTLGGLALRPQLFAMALFAATVWLVTARHPHPGRLWAIPPSVALWSNLHGSFFLPPVLLGLAWLEDRRSHSGMARRLGWFTALSLLATLLNPWGVRVWEYVWQLSTNDVVTGVIQEWQPTTLREIPGVLFFVSVVGVMAILARRGRAVPWPALLTLAVFFFIGLFAIRGVFWWGIVAPPVVARLLAETHPGVGGPLDDKLGVPLLNRAIAALLVALSLLFLPWWRGRIPLSPSTPLLDEAPLGITRFLARTLRPGDRIFNAQIWGSWFEFALPQNPVFADSRIEVLPESVWSQYSDVSRAKQGWQELLDRWHVAAVVAHPEQQRGLIPIIRTDPRWHLVYKDREGYVFARVAIRA